jgi:hypothetical protein
MCNACHNMCCGSDQFEGCGCDFCDEPDCWQDDEDFFDDDDGYDFSRCGCERPSAFRCEAVR